jgi:glycosyltransferase involved in cell wall biosynthesis
VSERHSISVIIPAYNRAGLIGETLQSLLKQTLPAKLQIIKTYISYKDGQIVETSNTFATE